MLELFPFELRLSVRNILKVNDKSGGFSQFLVTDVDLALKTIKLEKLKEKGVFMYGVLSSLSVCVKQTLFLNVYICKTNFVPERFC